jgi:hypothetical protein
LFYHRQHQWRELQAQGQAQGWTDRYFGEAGEASKADGVFALKASRSRSHRRNRGDSLSSAARA